MDCWAEVEKVTSAKVSFDLVTTNEEPRLLINRDAMILAVLSSNETPLAIKPKLFSRVTSSKTMLLVRMLIPPEVMLLAQFLIVRPWILISASMITKALLLP